MNTLKQTLGILSLSLFLLVSCKNEAKKTDNNNNASTTSTEKVVAPVIEIQENETTITVKPQSALEYKFKIKEGENITYEWTASGDLLFDFHGDPAEVDKFPKGFFKSYSKGTAKGEAGTQIVPFKGSHGWYWKNKSDEAITITLKTKGKYNIIGLIK